MNRIFGPCLVLVLLAAGLAPMATPQGSGTDPAQAPWWTPSGEQLPVQDFREGWNLRVPLVLEGDGRRAGAPVQVHLDLAKSLIEGGWPDRSGVPASFVAYPESVRLVEYTPDWQIEGEVPFRLHETWLEPDQSERYAKEQRSPFHGQRNPVVTLEWRLGHDLQAGEPHHYMVYFDIENNAGADQEHRKTVPSFQAADMESLDGLYWVGAGTAVFGHYPHNTYDNTMMVIATQGDTNVEVHTYRGRTTASLDQRQGGPEPSFNIGAAGQARAYSFGAQSTHFKVEADKPVVVMTHRIQDSSGTSGIPEFVPSREGGPLGWTFDVPEVAAGVYLIRPPGGQSAPTTVSVGGSSSSIPGSCETNNGNIVLRNVVDANGAPRVAFCRVTFGTSGSPLNMRSFAIQSGDPILVQFIPQGGAARPAQVPSALGSPVGANFHASAAHGQQCSGQPFTPSGGFDVTAWGPATVGVVPRTSPSPQPTHPDQAIEPQDPIYLPGRNLLQRSAACTVRDVAPHSVENHADEAAIQVRSGGFDNRPVPQTTPLGGRHGMEFQIQGPFVVYNHYPTTRIDLHHHADDEDETKVAGALGVPREFDDIPAGDMTSLSADKPVSVFPLGTPGTYARFHAAKPDFLVPDILPGQFRGYLIESRSADGTDPVFLAALPDEELDVPFLVRNHGRWEGAPLEDTVHFTAKVDSPNWDGHAAVGIDFDHRDLALADDSFHNNRLTLDLPEHVPSDTQLTIKVRAQSAGNGLMVQDFTVVVLVRQTFGVDMWFGAPNSISGLGNKALAIEEGQEQSVPFVIQNTGSNVDSFDVAVGSPGGGWDAWATDPLGAPLSRANDIAPGAQIGAVLHVRAPEVPQVESVFIPVTAVSVTSPLASGEISLFADLAREQGMELHASERLQPIAPGETRRFEVTLHNTGEGGLSGIHMELDAHLPDGWSVAFADLDPSVPIAVDPGEVYPVPLDLTAPLDAVADDFVSFLVRAEAGGVAADARAAISLSAVVDRTHQLQIATLDEVTLRPGHETTIDVAVRNDGNLPEEVSLEPVALPGGWNLTGLEETRIVEPGASATMTVTLRPPEGEPSGAATIVLQARSGGPAFPFPIPVRLAEVHDISWREAPSVVVQPGDAHEAVLQLANLGNVAERVTLEATGTWIPTLDLSVVDVPAASVRLVRVAWEVPAIEAEDAGEVRVVARAESGPAETLTLPVRVVAPRLDADEVVQTNAPRSPGSVGTIMAMLRNPGEAPVRDAEVRLVAGQDVVLEAVAFKSIGANGTAVAPLRWTAGQDATPERIEWGHWLEGEFHVLGTAPVPEYTPPDDRSVPLTPLVALVALIAVALRRRGGAA